MRTRMLNKNCRKLMLPVAFALAIALSLSLLPGVTPAKATESNSVTGTADSVTIGIPVWVQLSGNALPTSHATDTFKYSITASKAVLEEGTMATADMPMPASSTVTVACPSGVGAANKSGYGTGTSNPWQITFTEPGSYIYYVAETETTNAYYSYDGGRWKTYVNQACAKRP